MEYNGEDIRKAQMERRERILKSFGETSLFSGEGDSNKLMRSMEKAEEDDIEKAKHQDGDMHPNGRWVWRQSANGGKGDWRVANPKRGGGSRAASAVKTTSSEGDKSANKTYETKTTSKKDSKTTETPDTMVEIHKELSKKYDKEISPFTYTSNGVYDLKKEGKKGYAFWVGFQHAARGKQPVNKPKMQNFIQNTAIEHFLEEVNSRTGRKFTSKDVKVEDYWDSTDMFRIYIEVSDSKKTDDETKTTSKKDSKSKIDFKDVKGVGERYSFDLKKSDDKDKNELFDRIKDHFRFDNNKRGDKWSNSNVDDYIYKDKNGNYVVNVLNRLGNSGVYGEIANRIYNSDVRIVFNKNGKKWIATEHERRYYGLPNIERKLNFNFL